MFQQVQPNVSQLVKTERYVLAIEVAHKKGVSIRDTDRNFGLVHEPLRLRLRGLLPPECRPGPQLIYINADADVGLLEAIAYRSERGKCIGTSQLRNLCAKPR
ncbi:hypothetical protein GQ600_23579 [Phytophthora cactorum]|nr:hypothetical protein GQ600_23579 [Phytophthora cactorum]